MGLFLHTCWATFDVFKHQPGLMGLLFLMGFLFFCNLGGSKCCLLLISVAVIHTSISAYLLGLLLPFRLPLPIKKTATTPLCIPLKQFPCAYITCHPLSFPHPSHFFPRHFLAEPFFYESRRGFLLFPPSPHFWFCLLICICFFSSTSVPSFFLFSLFFLVLFERTSGTSYQFLIFVLIQYQYEQITFVRLVKKNIVSVSFFPCSSIFSTFFVLCLIYHFFLF